MLDRNQKAALVNPAFAAYGVEFGFKMTQWLFGDKQGNTVSWDDPAKWETAGRVAFCERTVTLATVPALSGTTPGTAVEVAQLAGGKNVIVFARAASVVTATPPAAAAAPSVLPNERACYVDMEIQRQSGFKDVTLAPLINTFGFGGRPNIRPLPELWLGNESRTFTASNRGNDIVRVDLTFTIAMLDTGR